MPLYQIACSEQKKISCIILSEFRGPFFDYTNTNTNHNGKRKSKILITKRHNGP